MLTRREVLQKAVLLLGGAAVLPPTWAAPARWQLGACDWSLGKGLNPEAFERAQQIGLQGVQVSYNTGKDAVGLSDPGTLQAIREAARRTGVKIASLAIGELNRVPYKSEPRTEAWVWNSVDAAKALGVQVVLLAFFAENDLRNDDAGKKVVVERLKKVAPHAAKQGITLGIESYLSAPEHLAIIEAVGSPAIKVYYDFRNAADAGYDPYQELPLLGKEMICELHLKENGSRLGEGTLDWPRIAELVDKVGYRGWMHIEGATPKGADVVECYRQNRKYLETLFSFR